MDLIPIKPPPKRLLEKDVEGAVKAYARRKGVLAYKFTSPSKRSVPDDLFLFKRGLSLFIEFKRPGAKATASQQREHARISAQGHNVAVVDDIAKGKALIDYYIQIAEGE